MSALAEPEFGAYLDDSRHVVLGEIRRFVPQRGRLRPVLYDLVLDYPLRAAKALRPALCIATCRALGGRLEAVLRSAAVIELYHNAFLVHDDVEDRSEKRRDQPTLSAIHGAPIAVNVGDAMLALSLWPLLENMQSLGLGQALRILQVVARMAQESAEGQALELDWVRRTHWQLTDADYIRMILKKTSWYSFVTPMLIGGIVAGTTVAHLAQLRAFAVCVGIGFQIQDDILNITADERAYGKEIGGDLWEGKHTLILLHALRSATAAERRRAEAVLAKPRPALADAADPDGPARLAPTLSALVTDLHERGQITAEAHDRLLEAAGDSAQGRPVKTQEDVRYLRALIERYDSIRYARDTAAQWSQRALARFTRLAEWIPRSVHRDFLESMAGFAVNREW
jgi:geranylgeranyl diphosphate synthase type II